MNDQHKPLTAAEIERDTVYVERITSGRECGDGCPCQYVNREDELGCILDGEELACTWEGVGRGNVYFRSAKCMDMLTPPPDAAVREAVEFAEGYLVPEFESIGNPHAAGIVRTLLRAVQSPRLTGEQREFLMHIEDCLATTNAMWPKEKKSLWYCLRAAFPEAFTGEVGRG